MNVLLSKLSELQLRAPWRVLAVALVSLVASLVATSQLRLRSQLGELLPANKPSVIVADRVAKRLPAISTLSVVVDFPHTASETESEHQQKNHALRRFAAALGPELEALDNVSRVEWGAKEARSFFSEHQLLYADLLELRRVHDDIVERYRYEVHRHTGLGLDDEDAAPPPLTEASLRQRWTSTRNAPEVRRDPFPEYYIDEPQHVLAVLVRTPIRAGDLEASHALQAAVRDVIADVRVRQGHEALGVGLTGDLITAAETHQRIKDDLSHVGAWGISLVLAVVFLFFLRLRALVLMALTVGLGTVWTFAVAYFAIGHLNSSSGFLVSIVVGNGINFGILFLARYLRARRQHDVAMSLWRAHRDTWRGTLTAACCAAAAYGSLVVTDFRGFRDFGVIGASGMLLCWLASYLVLPSLLVVSERAAPLSYDHESVLERWRSSFGRPFSQLATVHARAVITGAVVLLAASVALATGYVAADPIEKDMTQIGNEPDPAPSDARRLSQKVDRIVGRQGQDRLAIATDREGQAEPLRRQLHALRDSAPAGRKPFDRVVTVQSLVPTQQEAKLRLVAATRDTLQRAHARGFMSDVDWHALERFLPAKGAKPITVERLPESVQRAFRERNGTVGRLVYIVPATGRSVWDGNYLIDFADSFRETRLPDGSVVQGSGAQVIYADMILNVAEDAPRVLLVALIATVLVIAGAFRWRPRGLMAVGAMLMGLLWTVGLLAVWRTDWSSVGSDAFEFAPLRLNFLNFVALPITVGVGADYAVNMMHQRNLDPACLVERTGGAVVLCSLTTTLGYGALSASVNRAASSFGVAAAAGEVACVLAAALVLPAVLVQLRARRALRSTRAR